MHDIIDSERINHGVTRSSIEFFAIPSVSLRGKRILNYRYTQFYIIILIFLIFPGFASAETTLGLDETLKAMNDTEIRTEFRTDFRTEFCWDPLFSTGTISSGGHKAAFSAGMAGETGTVLMDYREVLTLPLPFQENGSLRFPETFVTAVKSSFSRYTEEDRTRFRIASIIIDPGHGGRDPGASWDYNIKGKVMKSVEKDITLQVSKHLFASLRSAFPDKRVLLTRTGDTNPTKDARVNLANSVPLAGNEAAIYISVHANSSFNRSARGYEVWYLNPSYRREVIDKSKYPDSADEPMHDVLPILNSMMEEELTTESILLANSILKRLGEAIGNKLPSRGLKAEEWFVVRNARMPSVLVELGFVSNETDALLMSDDAYLKNLSDALYKGITDFISFFEKSGGFTALQ